MAFNDIEKKKIELALDTFIEKRRPPVHIRKELDFSFRIENQSIYIYEIRPQWDDEKIICNYDIAKTTYVTTKKYWKIFWMKRDLKWHSYEPTPIVDEIEQFIDIVDKDAYGCFWG